MTSTRQLRKAALTRLFMLFDNDADDPIFLCFQHHQLRSVLDIISYDPTMLAGLTYVPTQPTSAAKKESDVFKQPSPQLTKAIPLEPQFQVQIKIIQGYVSYRIDIGQPINDEFHFITQHHIDEYRISNE